MNQKQIENSNPDPSSMTFFEHLEELRTRIISSLKVFLLVVVVCAFFYQPITSFYIDMAPTQAYSKVMLREVMPGLRKPAVDDSAIPVFEPLLETAAAPAPASGEVASSTAAALILASTGDVFVMRTRDYREARRDGRSLLLLDQEVRPLSIAPVETFLAMVKCVLLTAFVFASPWILYQVWLFVAPGLYSHEKKYAIPFVAASTFFFACGLCFAYFVGIPLAIKVLYSYDLGGAIQVQWTVERTLSFVLRLFLAFGIAFELPVVVFLLAALGIVTPQTLARQRPYVIVVLFVLAAILTPPDYVTQIILAGPLYLLFEISILAARIFVKQREKAEDLAEDPQA